MYWFKPNALILKVLNMLNNSFNCDFIILTELVNGFIVLNLSKKSNNLILVKVLMKFVEKFRL